MFHFEFKNGALKDLEKLSPETRKRILKKLKFFASVQNPFLFAERLKDFKFGEYRFRVGDHRVICDKDGYKIIILKIGHRKDIYQ